MESGSWKEYDFVKDNTFPHDGFAITAGATHFYIIGGSSSSNPQKTVYKSVDGYNWEKLSWELYKEIYNGYACITTNDQSGHENLVVFGKYWKSNERAILLYDLGTLNPATDNFELLSNGFGFSTTDTTHQLVCHAGWVHVATFDGELHSFKLSSLSEPGPPKWYTSSYQDTSLGGRLIIYDDKATIVGGADTNFANQKKLFYFDPSKGTLVEGPEFPWYKEVDENLVPVVTK